MFIFNVLSKQQDRKPEDRALRLRFKMLAGPGIILYVFVMSFAAIDWVVPFAPLGLHHLRVPFRRGTVDLLDGLHDRRRRAARTHRTLREHPPKAPSPRSGKLLLAFVMLWAYFDSRSS